MSFRSEAQPCCRPWRAFVALACGAAAAAAATFWVSPRLTSHPAPAAVMDSQSSAAPALDVQAEKAQALKLYDQVQPDKGSTEAFEAGIFGERQVEIPEMGSVKTVDIQSKRGIVVVLQYPGKDVIVVAGKRVIASNTQRAREYARHLRYDIKQDGDKMTVSVSKPVDVPRNVDAVAIGLVLAPEGVKVTSTSGS